MNQNVFDHFEKSNLLGNRLSDFFFGQSFSWNISSSLPVCMSSEGFTPKIRSVIPGNIPTHRRLMLIKNSKRSNGLFCVVKS